MSLLAALAVMLVVTGSASALTLHSGADFSALSQADQTGVEEAIAELYGDQINEGPVPNDIARQVLAALNQYQSVAPEDAAMGADELGAGAAGGLWDTGGLDLGVSALPEELAFAPESGGASLLVAAAAALGPALYAAVTGGSTAAPTPPADDVTGLTFESNAGKPGFGYPPATGIGLNPCWAGSSITTDSKGAWFPDQGSSDTNYLDAPSGGAACDPAPAGTANSYASALMDASGLLPTYAANWITSDHGTVGYWESQDQAACNQPDYTPAGPPFTIMFGDHEEPCWDSNNVETDPGTTMTAAMVPMADYAIGPLTQTMPAGVTVSPSVVEGAGIDPVTAPSASTVLSGIGSYLAAEPEGAPLLGVVSTPAQSDDNDVAVPDCESGYWNSDGSYTQPMGWPACKSLMDAAGLTAVEEPALGPPCNCDWGADSAVSMVTSDTQAQTDVTGQVVADGTTLYVWVDGYDPSQGSSGGGTTGATAPDCSGMTVPACEQAFEQAGFTEAAGVQWATPGYGVTSPGYIEIQSPEPNVVITQPSTEPVKLTGVGIIVPAPTPGEVDTSYESDLQTAGFPNYVETRLTQDTADPFEGANAVIQVVPTPGSVYDPSNAPQINFQSNPETMPEVATNPGGSGQPPDVYNPFQTPTVDPDGIEFPSIPEPCNVFPFGVPCWAVAALGALNASPQAPHFQFTVGAGPISPQTLDVNLGTVFGQSTDTVMTYVRPALVFVTVIGFVLWLAGRGGGGGGGESYNFPAQASAGELDSGEWD